MEFSSIAEFIATFLAAVSYFSPENSDPRLKPADTPQNEVQEEYDFIIVGAGSAGCVVANRLTEIEDWSVLLIEAGGDEDAFSDAPRLNTFLRQTDKDWNYTTVRQEKACLKDGGICGYPRGRVMGGSSTINAMMYVRGNEADYNEWAAAGNVGWSYPEVLPYFIKSENITIPELQNSPYRGRNGYLTVGYPVYRNPLAEKFIEAGKEFGWKEGDYNGEDQETISYLQSTLNGPSRESTSKAYLNPIKDRKNLSIIKRTIATKLIIEGDQVKGVEYYRNGSLFKVTARKEVILSAGAIDTPKLLLLSGIGPKEELSKHGIQQVAELPVGKNLQDHLQVHVKFEIDPKRNFTAKWETEEAIEEYLVQNKGPITSAGSEALTFLNILNENEPPNLQVIFIPPQDGLTMNGNGVLIVLLCGVYPKSRGSVTLKSKNWKDPPLIDPNYLSEEEDLKVYQKGFKLALDYMKTPTMQSINPKFSTDSYSLCNETMNLDDYITCIIETYSITIYHPVSTAKMGPAWAKDNVVTPDLLVKGFQNLRVIDASVMHGIMRGNTNAPTIMIGEKGADLIKKHHQQWWTLFK